MKQPLDQLISHLGERRDTVQMFVDHMRATHTCGVLIETGTIREHNGNGTRWMAMLAIELGAKFYSVDVDPKAQRRALRLMDKTLFDRTTFITEDSVVFLQRTAEVVEGVYLDSLDSHAEQWPDAQQHQLREAQAVAPLMMKRGAILLDDDANDYGKGMLARPWLLANGWTLKKRAYQSILVRCP